MPQVQREVILDITWIPDCEVEGIQCFLGIDPLDTFSVSLYDDIPLRDGATISEAINVAREKFFRT